MEFNEPCSYAGDSVLQAQRSYEWMFTLADAITGLIDHGLVLEFVHEFPYTIYHAFPGMVQREDGFYEFEEQSKRNLIPLLFSIRAHKPAN